MKLLRIAAAALLLGAALLAPPAARQSDPARRTLPPAESQDAGRAATADGVYSLEWDEAAGTGLLWFTRWDTACAAPLCARRGCTHTDASCPARLEGGAGAWQLFAGNGRLLLLQLEQETGTVQSIWAVSPDGTGRALLRSCPGLPGWQRGSLLWEDDSGFWFWAWEPGQSASQVVFLPAGGQEYQQIGLLPGSVLAVRDSAVYSIEYRQDGETYDWLIRALDLHSGQQREVCSFPMEAQLLLREDTLYFCHWQDGCALYTKNLQDSEPPRLRCRLTSLGSSFAELVDAKGDRVVLQRAGAQWAVDLNSGARTWVQPAWLTAQDTEVWYRYPYPAQGTYCGGHALVWGYERTDSQYALGDYGRVDRTAGSRPAPCILDRDAWLAGQVRLTDVTVEG